MAYEGIGSVLRGLYARDDQLAISDQIRHLKAGDRVLSKSGIGGKVLKTYRRKDTNQLVACTVVWDHENNGDLITILVPIEDLSLEDSSVLGG